MFLTFRVFSTADIDDGTTVCYFFPPYGRLAAFKRKHLFEFLETFLISIF